MSYSNIFATFALAALLLTSAAALPLSVNSAEVDPAAKSASSPDILLPAPDMQGGKPLMQALALRKSHRRIDADKPITDQDLSNLLWAAFGINRADGKRTIPTAKNTQEVAVYVVKEQGVFLYNAKRNALELKTAEDMRSKFGGAPVTLLFAAPEGHYAGMHVGSAYQNVGLYCASAELANVVKGTGVNAAEAVKDRLALPKGYQFLIIQSIGYAK